MSPHRRPIVKGSKPATVRVPAKLRVLHIFFQFLWKFILAIFYERKKISFPSLQTDWMVKSLHIFLQVRRENIWSPFNGMQNSIFYGLSNSMDRKAVFLDRLQLLNIGQSSHPPPSHFSSFLNYLIQLGNKRLQVSDCFMNEPGRYDHNTEEAHSDYQFT